MNAKNVLDGIAVIVKLAVSETGPKTVIRELRRLADHLERTGDVPGWKFPADHERTKVRLQPTSSRMDPS